MLTAKILCIGCIESTDKSTRSWLVERVHTCLWLEVSRLEPSRDKLSIEDQEIDIIIKRHWSAKNTLLALVSFGFPRLTLDSVHRISHNTPYFGQQII